MSYPPAHSPAHTLDALANDLDHLIETGANKAAWRDLETRIETFCQTLTDMSPDMAQDCRGTLGDMITRIETYLNGFTQNQV